MRLPACSRVLIRAHSSAFTLHVGGSRLRFSGDSRAVPRAHLHRRFPAHSIKAHRMSKPGNLPQQLDHMLRQAVALQQNGAFVEAEELYREILELKPRHFDALKLLGELALQTGRAARGQRVAQKGARRQRETGAGSFESRLCAQRIAALSAKVSRAPIARSHLQPNFPDALNNRGNAQAGAEPAARCTRQFRSRHRVDAGVRAGLEQSRVRAARPGPCRRSARQLRSRARAAAELCGCVEQSRQRAQRPEPAARKRSAAIVARWNWRRRLPMPGTISASRRSISISTRRRCRVTNARSRSIPRRWKRTGTSRCVCCKWGGSKPAGSEYEWRWERARIKADTARFRAAAVARRFFDRRQDDSVARGAGSRRYAAVLPLCGAGVEARRESRARSAGPR